MNNSTHQPPANENIDPFFRPDTALNELLPLRRAFLAQDTSAHTFEQWRRRRQVLSRVNKAIDLCLSML